VDKDRPDAGDFRRLCSPQDGIAQEARTYAFAVERSIKCKAAHDHHRDRVGHIALYAARRTGMSDRTGG